MRVLWLKKQLSLFVLKEVYLIFLNISIFIHIIGKNTFVNQITNYYASFVLESILISWVFLLRTIIAFGFNAYLLAHIHTTISTTIRNISANSLVTHGK